MYLLANFIYANENHKGTFISPIYKLLVLYKTRFFLLCCSWSEFLIFYLFAALPLCGVGLTSWIKSKIIAFQIPHQLYYKRAFGNEINELNYFAYAQIKIGFVFQNKGKPCFYEKKQERWAMATQVYFKVHPKG
jgi:hypothetical protein